MNAVIDENVALVARILLDIADGFDEFADLKVRNIAGCAGTSARSRSRSLANISAVLAIATRGRHLKRAAVECHADHDLAGLHAGMGDHSQCACCLRLVDMGPQTIASWTSIASRGEGVSRRHQENKGDNKGGDLLGPGVTVIPLSVHIVGHVDDVVHHLRHVSNWKAFEIPKRSRSREANSLASWEPGPHQLQEIQVVGSVLWATRRDADVGGTGVFPIEVNAVKPIVHDERDNFGGNCLSLRRCHALAENREGVVVGREGPTSKRHNTLDAADSLEVSKLAGEVANADVKSGRNGGKREVLAVLF